MARHASIGSNRPRSAGASLAMACLAWLAPGLAREAAALDVLHFVSGDPVNCEILEITDRLVRVKVNIEVAGGEAYATKIFQRGEIAFIDFGPLPGETLLLESGGLQDLEAFEELWTAERPHLARPNSNAGEIGNRYANLLLESGAAGAAGRAREIFSRVEKEDWDAARRAGARQGRLRALLALGEIDEAVAEASAISGETGDLGILLDAEHILATADFGKLRKLVEANPRWEQDDEIRPERNELYHGIIDRFLHPYLFHGSDENAAARGLWSAVEVHRHAGEEESARQRAADIIALYPASAYSGRAREYLATREEGSKPAAEPGADRGAGAGSANRNENDEGTQTR